MAEKGAQLEILSCSICLDLLKDPVALPCGHSYCMNCIQSFWDEKEIYSCPQCRQTFTPRPVLVKNTMLADLVEELKKTGLTAAPLPHCYAGAEDVTCDVCTGRKLKAFKSCLVCRVSYCEKHLQPHHDVPQFKKHKLVEPSNKLQENICSRHDEVMKMFCRTDQLCICYLCSMDEHKGHDTVSAAAEWTKRQRELEGSRPNVQQRIQNRHEDQKGLLQEVEDINDSADEAVDHIDQTFDQLIRLLEDRRSGLKQQVRSQQQTEVSRVKELQEELQQEVAELERTDAKMEKLSHTEDHNQFLQDYASLPELSEDTHSPSLYICLRYFDDVTVIVTELRDKLQDVLTETGTNVSQAVEEVDVLLPQPQPEPKTRDEFFSFSRGLTLDPNTVNYRLLLCDDKKVTLMMTDLPYSDHPDRFNEKCQVLSRESLTGRCYWEVKKGEGGVIVAVSYEDIEEETFGHTDESWALGFFKHRYEFRHNGIITPISGPLSSRVGVYLDHCAGILSFYSVSDTLTLLHTVQTRFTQPLYAGLCLYAPVGNTAQLCDCESESDSESESESDSD